jgi:hypothetical protein
MCLIEHFAGSQAFVIFGNKTTTPKGVAQYLVPPALDPIRLLASLTQPPGKDQALDCQLD